MSKLVDAMMDALVAGSSFQSIVKEAIEEGKKEFPTDYQWIAERICAAVSAFKEESERRLSGIETEDWPLFRKKANNIINDVSRICREQIGYSIVNYKRSKGMYSYKAVQWTEEKTRTRRSAYITGGEGDLSHVVGSPPARPATIEEWMAYAIEQKWPVMVTPSTVEEWVNEALKGCTLEDLAREVVNRAKVSMGAV